MAAKGKNEYIVKVKVTSDTKNKTFLPGDVVTDKDFPAKVIENWLELGVLVEKEASEDE